MLFKLSGTPIDSLAGTTISSGAGPGITDGLQRNKKHHQAQSCHQKDKKQKQKIEANYGETRKSCKAAFCFREKKL